jgi:hypothetical protein
MDPISHVASFYLLGRRVGAKRLWVGMVTTLLPDMLLILTFFANLLTGQRSAADSTSILNLYLHSVFALLILLPIAVFSLRYFYVSVAGYSMHLLLDYLTHTTVRMPFYPLTDWKAPTLLVSYLDPAFLLTVSMTIFALTVNLERKRVGSVVRALFRGSLWKRVKPLLSVYTLLAYAFPAVYVSTLAPMDPMLFVLCSFLLGTNLLLIGFLFCAELYDDKNIQTPIRRMVRFLFGESDNRDDT